MPIVDCIKNGKPGRKYGKDGTCYTGKDAQKKARKQTAAIHLSRTRRKPYES